MVLAETTEQSNVERTAKLRRRGVIAGVGALVAGMVAKQVTTVEAQAGQALIIDGNNTGGKTTSLTSLAGAPAFQVLSNGVAIQGNIPAGSNSGTPVAVQAISFANASLATSCQCLAFGTAPSTFAVEGRNDGNGLGRVGVLGTIGAPSDNGTTGNPNPQTSGVTGLNLNTGSSAYGVIGMADAATGYGVVGQSERGIGVYGISHGSYGVVGATTAAGFYGIYGFANTNGSVAFAGGTSNPAAYAAVFGGTVQINGPLIVTGAKSAAVPHADGTHRLVYCVEAPESWFEDFGEAKLVAGKADVKLDVDFAGIADMASYHVFLTPRGDSKGLYVTNQTAGAFAVREQQNGTSNLTFSWRVVAKRKDIKTDRLAKYTVKELKLEDPMQGERIAPPVRQRAL